MNTVLERADRWLKAKGGAFAVGLVLGKGFLIVTSAFKPRECPRCVERENPSAERSNE